MIRNRPLLMALCAMACSRGANVGSPPSPSMALSPSNPFYNASTLPYQAPPFDRIHDADFEPAMDAGMQQQIAEMNAIAAVPGEPTFENTIAAMERSGALLTRASKVFFALTSANTDDTIQKVQADLAPRLAAHYDAIFLNDALYRRVHAIYERRDVLKLTPEQKHLVEYYEREFVRAGVRLSDADKARIRALNQEEGKLTTDFQTKLLAATKAGGLVVSDSTQLAGLSAADLASAASSAKDRGLTGKWVLPLQNTTQQPAQASLANRALREVLFVASTQRAEHGDTNDTRAVVKRLAEIRAERAKLLGFPTFAAFQLDDQMAKTPDAAITLLTDVVPAATAKARSEAADMQHLIDREEGARRFTLAPWDWQYYAERVRKANYDLDEAQLKPYFELNRVLNDGVFFAAHQMYGVTFKERHDIPVYHPDVRVFEVFDADGAPLALWYADYFKRDNKSGGAWEDSFVDQSGLLGTKAVVFNVANFTKPAPGQPALLTFDDVTTMFHEFGHALHGMFSNVQYPTFSGTNVARDFVEFPSQFNEHWALDSTVFEHYARHYQTGSPMPRDLVDRIKKTRTFNQGFATTEYLAAALLDMAWHTLPAGPAPTDVDAFEKSALARFKVNVSEVPPRYRTTYFAHIWNGGYAAGYYAYFWSEVLDDDAYYWFLEHGGMTRANGQRFRDMILSRGATEDPAALFRAFRGREPVVQPLLQERGLTGKP